MVVPSFGKPEVFYQCGIVCIVFNLSDFPLSPTNQKRMQKRRALFGRGSCRP